MPDPADFTYRGRPFAAPGPPAPATPAQAASALERLEGTYRRLLRAYPRDYRHERGLEILTTLIDSAKPGQRRPAWRDAADLVLGGLRYRLSPPPGAIPAIVAAVVALLIGLSLCGATARLVWQAQETTPRPGDPEVIRKVALADSIVGARPEQDPGVFNVKAHHLDWLGKGTAPSLEGWGGPNPSPRYIKIEYRPGPGSAQIAQGAHARLDAEGWTVGELRAREHGQVFWAAKDDLLVRVQQLHLDGSEPSIVVQVHPAEPRRVAVSGFAALGAGVLIGWMLACWTLRRLTRHGPLGKALILSAGLPALAATSLLVVFMLGGLGSLFAYWGWAERHLIYPTQVIGESLPLALLAFGASAAALFAAALPIRPGAGRWRAVIAVAFLAALTVLVAYVAYRIIS